MSDLVIKSVHRGGDFQSITFTNGSTVYGGSEQDGDGEWIDNRAIDALVDLLGGKKIRALTKGGTE